MPNIKIFSRPRSHELGHLKLQIACSWTSAAAQTEVTAASTASHGRTPRTWHDMEGLWAVAEVQKKVTQTFTLKSENKELDGIVDSNSFLRLHWLLSSNFKNSFLHPFTSLTWVKKPLSQCLDKACKYKLCFLPSTQHAAILQICYSGIQIVSHVSHGAVLPRAWKAMGISWRESSFGHESPSVFFDLLASTSPARWYNNIPGSKVWTHEHGDSGHCHTWSLLIWSPHIAAVNIEIKDVPITPVQMWKTCSKLIQYYMLKCPKLYETFKIKKIQLWASIPIQIEFSYF